MKTYLQFFFILLISQTLISQYYVRGDHNGWGTGNQLVQRVTLAGGSTYSTVIQASFDQKFKIANAGWSNQWGSGYWITSYDQRWTIGANGSDATWKGSILAYTQVNCLNPDDYVNQNLPAGIMTLSSNPVTVTSVSQVGTDIGGGNFQINSTLAQTVNIVLSGTKSSQEKVYLRYTSNGWSSSSFLLANGSGTAYSATIPGQADGTTVSYYVLTTTLTHGSGNDLDQYPDLMTLNYNNNNGTNYSYQVKESYGFFASAVYLDVNNSSSEFYNCHGHGGAFQIGAKQFAGNLGTFPQNSNKLLLNGGEIKTWKNTSGNVCVPNLYYRVFTSGSPSGSFIPFDLQFFCDCSGGAFPGSCGGGTCSANDQKWQSPGVGSVENINLLNRTPGDYTLEIYFDITGNHNATSGCTNTVYDNNNGINYSINFTVSAALPFNLLSFYANATSKNILLSWTTDSETDNSHFEVQKSINVNDFIDIGKVSGAGTSYTKNNYEFEDHEPLPSINYYRLKQVNNDGSFTFSPLVRVVFKDTDYKKIRVIPTLAQTSITCEIDDPKYDGEITILSIYGQLIKEIEVNYQQKEVFIDISDLASGQYILRYSNPIDSESEKFIKQ